jgi:hypothetical protein
MAWFRKWRVLVVAYSLATIIAVREVIVSRASDPVAWPSEEWSEMVEVVSTINPDEADTQWLESMEFRLEGDAEDFALKLEESLATDIKHNEFMLQDYTQLMLDRGADYQIINWAANRWRENHPFSTKTLRLELMEGPANDAEVEYLKNVMEEVPWISNVVIQPSEDSSAGRWFVLIGFRPAQDIDIREAIEAVSLLTLTPEQRETFRVTCFALDDCTLITR